MGKDHKKSRREEKDHGSRERERSKTRDTSREREKEVYKSLDKDRRVSSKDGREDGEEYNKDKYRDKAREKEYDQRDRYRDKEREKEKDQKDRAKDKDREREKETDKEHHDGARDRREKDKEKKERDREKEGDRGRDREREKHKDREREKEKEKDKERDKFEREKGTGKDRVRDRKADNKERSKDKDKVSVQIHDMGDDKAKDEKRIQQDGDDTSTAEHKRINEVGADGRQRSSSELEQRILEMKEARLKRKSEEVPEILAWVSKSRKLEEKMNTEKQKALHLSKVFEEQDNSVLEEAEDEEPLQHTMKDLAGVKVLHGVDKVMEGGAVILTLKDQNILADGDINDEVDMLENVEIGEQKQRDGAYKAAKKKTGIYDDKFNDEIGAEKKMLSKYDDPVEDEGVTLDESGRFTGTAEKKLEELRKRIHGVSSSSTFEDLNASGKISSDYYTQEEMLQFKKPKKKKSLRKKDKLDLDALEAEAKSAGLGVGDLGSRKDGRRQAAREEQERSEAQMRSDAYQSAYAKAEEASKALRQEVTSTFEENENPVFGDEDEDLYKSLAKARKLALKSQDEAAPSGVQKVASLALASRRESADTGTSGDLQENKVVFTEMEEFVMGIQLDEEIQKPRSGDIYNDEDEDVKASDKEMEDEKEDERKDEAGGWTELNNKDAHRVNKGKEKIVPDDSIREVPVGKGVGSLLSVLKDRGYLHDSIEWGGRNMDKKKSKLVGIHENDGPKEIHIERLDEFGRVMTPKEAFRMISHKFHGKEPGKMKKEKRIKAYYEELKLKQMKNSDTPLQSMERMREAQAHLQTPYLVLSGNVKSGQNSDSRSGFATVEGLPGGLTPMLGDRKVEHFLGIKRKPEPGSSNLGPQKKPKN